MQLTDSTNGHHDIKKLLTPYCFGDATEAERLAFEAHLLDCDDCWNEVQRLDAAIQTLRRDRSLVHGFMTPAALGFFGPSGRIRSLLGGHLWYVLFACLLYSSLYAISFLFEVLEFQPLTAVTWGAAVLVVFPWIFGTSVFALFMDWKLTIQGNPRALVISSGIFLCGVVVLLIFIFVFFPDHPASSLYPAAYPPKIAYIKDVAYCLPYALAYLLLPFHFIVTGQEELRSGRHRKMLTLLTGDKTGVPSRGTVFPRVWALALVLALLAVFSIAATNTLFDGLGRGPRASLFMLLIQLKGFLYFLLGVACLVWYSRSLDELKRECLVILKTLEPIL
jgi:hypothetical protein